MKKIHTNIFILFLISQFLSSFAYAQTDPAKSVSPDREAAFEHFKKGNNDQAVKLLVKHVKLNPKDCEAWNVLGSAYLNSAALKDGRKALEKTVNCDPRNANYHANLAYAYLVNKKNRDALSESRKALELDPKNRMAYVVQGTTYLWQNDTEKALISGDKALDADKSFPPAYILKADALLQSFSRQATADLENIDGLDLLEKSIAVLENCLKICDKKSNLADHRERIDGLTAFVKYFDRKKAFKNNGSLPPQENVTGVIILSKPRPAYTESARSAGISGRIRIAVLFSADGTCRPLLILEPLSNGLNEAAMASARGIKFEPQKENGKPVSVVKVVEYNFLLY